MSVRIPQSELDALAQALTTVAVTGTNGKTTTTSMVAAIVRAAGRPVARVTTLGMWVDDDPIAPDGSMESFVKTLRAARQRGAEHLALEVTSRALEGGFARRFAPDIAVFTNLTPDHLDRHGTPERYLAAKAQLFLQLPATGVAVLNACDPSSALLAEVLPSGVERRRYCACVLRGDRAGGPHAAELWATGGSLELSGSRVELDGPLSQRLGGALQVGTPGAFNVDNALAAALAADAAGLDAAAIGAGLAGFGGVEGRFQIVARAPLCIVDFAHTPDALTRVIDAARRLAAASGGRLACVFGCGGERDPGKRAPMGAIADRGADAVWLTTDNPRSEDPAAIAAAVRAGATGHATWHEVPERREAIAAAIMWARDADVVLVAGRGHEREQLLAAGAIESSDAAWMLAALASR